MSDIQRYKQRYTETDMQKYKNSDKQIDIFDLYEILIRKN